MLQDRYQKSCTILRAHVHVISTQKQFTDETARDLCHLIETVEGSQLVLENMDQLVDQQDIFSIPRHRKT